MSAPKKDDVGLADLKPDPAPGTPEAKPEPTKPAFPPNSVTAHALETGHAKRQVPIVNFGAPVSPVPVLVFSAEHTIAAMLHGWTAHEQATGQPFECPRQAYLDAIKAANRPTIKRAAGAAPPKFPAPRRGGPRPPAELVRHTYEPLAAATSPHAPHAIARKG